MGEHKTGVIYRKADGLYLTALSGEPPAQLVGSDSNSRLLTASLDGQLLCYTAGENKVYILNLNTNKVETFDYVRDPRASYHPLWGSAPYATFVQSGKGLVFISDGFFVSETGKIVRGYPDRVLIKQPNLFYYALDSKPGLQLIDRMVVIAEPHFSDSHIYYELPPVFGQADSIPSIISNNLDTGTGRTIVTSKNTITSITVGGSAQGAIDRRSLFYTTANFIDGSNGNELISYSVYSKTPPEGSNVRLLVETVPVELGQATEPSVTASAMDTRKVAVIADGILNLFMLDPEQRRASSLKVEGGGDLSKATKAEFSPDGSRLMLTGVGEGLNEVWYALLGANNQLALPPVSYISNGGTILSGWLNDGVHYYDNTLYQITIIDTARGKVSVLAERSQIEVENFKPIGLLSNGQTVLYLMEKGLYSTNLDELHPNKLLTDVEDAWLITP